MRARRVLSGIQPTGVPHLGNYLGAVRRWAAEAAVPPPVDGHGANMAQQRLYCVVDLHALTVPRRRDDLRAGVRDTAAALVACGLRGGSSCSLFVQSEVEGHADLTWLLGCLCPESSLRMMTQYKEKKKSHKGSDGAHLGLFSYPVLMAADILLYGATHVPVGEDQAQHLELARQLCDRFNAHVGADVLVRPIPELPAETATLRVRSLRDPSSKMSKSDPVAAARIDLDDGADVIAKKVARAVTDGEPVLSYEPESRPAVANLVGLLAALRGAEPEAVVREINAAHGGAAGGKALKDALAEQLVASIGPIASEIERHRADPSEVDAILDQGRDNAQAIASETLDRARDALGIARRGTGSFALPR